MRWLSFILVSGLVLTLQSAVAPSMEVFGARPNWVLVLVVFFALHVKTTEAAIGAWAIGFVADLMTVERMGLLALTYLLVVLVVSTVRELLFCRRGSAQFAVTLVVSMLVQVGWLIYRQQLYGLSGSWSEILFIEILLGSVYTAIWAPAAHKVLLSASRWLGVPQPRYSHAGLPGMVKGSV